MEWWSGGVVGVSGVVGVDMGLCVGGVCPEVNGV